MSLTMPATFTSCSADDRTTKERRSSSASVLAGAYPALISLRSVAPEI